MRNEGSDVGVGDLDAAPRTKRVAIVERLRGGQEFDSQHVLDVVQHHKQLHGADRAHRDMVLLPQARRDRIDRGGVAEDFVFGDERGGGVLRDHKARVDAGLFHEQLRQAVVAFEQEVGAALGDAGEFGQGQGGVVEHKGQRLPVEVAAAEDVAAGEDERVVRDAVDLGLDDGAGVGEHVAAGPVHLGHATQAVRVLHLAAEAMRLQDLAVAEQGADVLGHAGLPRMRAEGLDPRVEGLEAALQGFEAHGRQHVGGKGEMEGALEHEGSVGAHQLGAVDEREAVFGMKRLGRQAVLGQHLGGRAPAGVVVVPEQAEAE